MHGRASSFLIGLIGAGIQASRAPAMHEREGVEQGLNYVYRLIDLDRLELGSDALPKLIEEAEHLGFNGLNVTHPCKQAVIPLLTELSEDARAIGAVNTILLRDGKRIGHNTDWSGFAESFRSGLPDASVRRVLLLGAGGAGAAVAYAAMNIGVQQLSIVDIDQGRAQSLAAELVAQFGQGRAVATTDVESELAESDGLIHATPMGMTNHPGMPLPENLLRPHLWVGEIVYFPLETELLGAAREVGCKTLDGAGMAVYQAAEAFRLFTGLAPDVARMRRFFESSI